MRVGGFSIPLNHLNKALLGDSMWYALCQFSIFSLNDVIWHVKHCSAEESNGDTHLVAYL
jgi:hypothetical protein